MPPDYEALGMPWAKPEYTREQINMAGKALVAFYESVSWDNDKYDAYEDALPIINNWRSSHNHPLNTFKVHLYRSVSKVDTDALIAQRIKRLSSIELKLHRFPKMKLSQMQDLGGCRAVVKSVAAVISSIVTTQTIRTQRFTTALRSRCNCDLFFNMLGRPLLRP